MHPQKFNPEISTYMVLNGFKKVDECAEIGTLCFRKADVAVLFWNDKVEKRIVSADKLKVTMLLTSFKGFDGKNIFHLMLILHLMQVIDLKEVSATVYATLGTDVAREVETEFNIPEPVSAY